MEKILEILKGMNDTVDFANETGIIDNELIDSVELMELITELEDCFGVTIEMEDVVPANFNSIEAMWALINRLQ